MSKLCSPTHDVIANATFGAIHLKGDQVTNAPIIAIYTIYVQMFFCSLGLSSVHHPIKAHQRLTCNSLSSVQIDYSLPRPSQREGTFHIMPLLSYVTLATVNFLDAIGANPNHLSWFQENEAEFSRYKLPRVRQLKDAPHWVGNEASS